jgi:hypothetical protein
LPSPGKIAGLFHDRSRYSRNTHRLLNRVRIEWRVNPATQVWTSLLRIDHFVDSTSVKFRGHFAYFGLILVNTTSHLKKAFWPHIFVGGKIQILGILEYASGLNFASAAIWSQNPFFEMACNK